MTWDNVQQIARILAYGVSGYLVNAGQLEPANFETLGGALLGLLSVAWWFFWNRKKEA
jgi:hypothetical protein